MRPIVLLHGFLGFDRLWTLEYFKGVPDFIRHRWPGARVLTPALDPDAPIAERARALAGHLDRAFDADERVHLIAHSMGGLDARCYISSPRWRGDRRVVSLTTLGTPHGGSPAAAWMARIFSGRRTAAYAEFVRKAQGYFRGAGPVASYLFDLLSPFDGALHQLTPSAMVRFNRAHPNRPGVRYFSYAGVVTSDRAMSPLLGPFHEIILRDPDPRAGGPNDGLVSVASARGDGLGDNGFVFIKTLRADHFQLIGHDWSPRARARRWLSGRAPRRGLAVYDRILRTLAPL